MTNDSIPTLKTERLTLRPQTMDDFPAYADMMASPRSIGMGGPYNAKTAWGLFCHDLALWPLFGHGALMIDIGETGQCIGQVGINHGPLFPEKELGWMLYEGNEGRGYATEAAFEMRRWAFAELKLTTLVSYVDPANAASIAVIKRLGGTLDASAPKQDPEDLVFRYRA